jgi:hypothetical protein
VGIIITYYFIFRNRLTSSRRVFKIIKNRNFFQEDNGPQTFRVLGDAIKDLREEFPQVADFSPRKKKYLSLVPPGGNWRTLPVELQKESLGKAYLAKEAGLGGGGG